MNTRVLEWLVPDDQEPNTVGLENLLAQATHEATAQQRDRLVVDFAARESLDECAYMWAETVSRRVKLLQDTGFTYVQMLRRFDLMNVYQVNWDIAAGLRVKGVFSWLLFVAPALVNSRVITKDASHLITSSLIGCRATQSDIHAVKLMMIKRIGFFSDSKVSILSDEEIAAKYHQRESKFCLN